MIGLRSNQFDEPHELCVGFARARYTHHAGVVCTLTCICKVLVHAPCGGDAHTDVYQLPSTLVCSVHAVLCTVHLARATSMSVSATRGHFAPRVTARAAGADLLSPKSSTHTHMRARSLSRARALSLSLSLSRARSLSSPSTL